MDKNYKNLQLELSPKQIITLNDFPVHSTEVLNDYFEKCKSGKEIALVPVIRKEIVKQYFYGETLKEFEIFIENNPAAEYFMLDGSHRTTALTITNRKIKGMIYETDEDIKKARSLVTTGQILENGTLDWTIKENCEFLNEHFSKTKLFQTVEQKTMRMVTEKVISEKMIDFYVR